MKRLPFPTGIFIFVFLMSVFSSCKKNDHDDPKPIAETVEIAGEKYAIVKIGTQTWTATNYRGAGGVNYDNANSRPEYGKYYSYNEAQAIQVPSGWRLPSIDDFLKLAQSQGVVIDNYRATKQDAIKKITSKNNWLNINGNNQSGFNAYPAGYVFKTSAPIEGDISEFWTVEKYTFSIQESADQKNHNILVYNNSTVDDFKFNVRFVKDN